MKHPLSSPDPRSPRASPDARGIDGRELHRLRARVRQLEQEVALVTTAAERQARAARAVVGRYIRAQRISRLGSWEWDRRTGLVTCSAELYRILGMAAHEPACSVRNALQPVHDRDRRLFL